MTPASWQHVPHGVPAGALLEAANVLAVLAHHARTFPAPSPLDDTVVRHAARDLLAATRTTR